MQSGSVGVGDTLRVVQRPHPDLTLARVSQQCYGSPKNKVTCLIDELTLSDADVQRLVACEELARFEWRDRLVTWRAKRDALRRQYDEARRARQRITTYSAALFVLVLAILIAWRLS
jgi:hypothetical protein